MVGSRLPWPPARFVTAFSRAALIAVSQFLNQIALIVNFCPWHGGCTSRQAQSQIGSRRPGRALLSGVA